MRTWRGFTGQACERQRGGVVEDEVELRGFGWYHQVKLEKCNEVNREGKVSMLEHVF